MAHLQYAHVPGFTSIIFRRTKTDLNLPDSALSRAHSWWQNTSAEWNGAQYGYEFPTLPGQPPSLCVFGFLATDDDRFRYQSAAFQLIWFDELTQFTEVQYTYLFSRLRKPNGMSVPLRMRGSSNPGGAGHDWVKARFITHAKPEGNHYVSPPSTEDVEAAKITGEPARGAAFVPARLSDNPGIDKSYRASLARLDAVTRRQLEDGDWTATAPGEYFARSDFKFVAEVPPGLSSIRYWDLAGTKPHEGNSDPDWTAGCLMHIRRNKDETIDLFISDVRRARDLPGEIEKLVKKTSDEDGPGVPIVVEEEPGGAGKNNTANYETRVLKGRSVRGHRKTGPKPLFWRALSSQATNGHLYLVKGDWNEEFVRELVALPGGSHDDQADAASGAFDRLINGPGDLITMASLGLM